MAYADQQGMSTGRIVSIAAVLLLHAFLGYALVTGLAYEAVKNVKERLEVLDIEEEVIPEDEPPPPPPEEVIVVPPPAFAVKTDKPTENKSRLNNDDDTKKKPDPDPTTKDCYGRQIAFTATCVQEDPMVSCPSGTKGPGGASRVKQSQLGLCKAPEKDLSQPAKPRNSKSRWVTTNDYPSRSLQREEEGTSRLNMTVGANGKVTACTASGATPALNKAACKFAKRRAKFKPALDKRGNPTTGRYSTSVRWQIPPR